ncbi:MAG: hypothetical protein NC228_02460, partial [[Eubacterium] siraeum]|nr:hypothetical protein [[Eubacterium] siraeum]
MRRQLGGKPTVGRFFDKLSGFCITRSFRIFRRLCLPCLQILLRQTYCLKNPYGKCRRDFCK